MHRIESSLLVGGMAVLSSITTFAAVIHVPGDQQTIQQGIDSSAQGDTVTIAPGTYGGSIDIIGRSVFLRSDSGHSVTFLSPFLGIRIDASGGNPSITVEGFTVALSSFSPALRAHNSGKSARLVIRQNRFTGNRNDVIFATWFGEIDIHHNLFDSNHSVDKSAIYFEYSPMPSSRVFNNTIYDNTYGIFGLFPPFVRNNIVVHNSRVGVTYYYYADSAIQYNNVFGNAQGNYDRVPVGAGSISVPPLFVDTSADDFRLQWNSPCVDAGDPSMQYNDPDGTRSDMGAFHHVCAATDDSADCDQDGVLNLFDNCPFHHNESQTDSDNDGIGNVCDSCPLDSLNDPDGDGFCSLVDNCPLVFNVDQADSNANGIGDACECVCRCHGDPNCDSIQNDILDVVNTINVAFGSLAALTDPSDPCPIERTDVDCSNATDVVDVVKVINVVFRGAIRATEYCQPCQ